jgi:hypothetical protein
MKICANCKTEYKEKGLIECPNCKTKLLKKNNILAIVSFVLSMAFPLTFIVFALFSILLKDNIIMVSGVILFLAALSAIAEVAALTIGIVALAMHKNYYNNNIAFSIAGLVISLVIFGTIFIRILKPVDDYHPEDYLNSTVQMNWKG